MSSLLKHKSTHPVQREKGKERTSSSNKDANTEKAINIDTANKVQQQQHDHGYKGFFKRHFSLNLKHRNTSTTDGNSTTHSPRMVSPSPRVSKSLSLSLSLPLSSPGPASPTVQHTDHVPTPLREKLYLDKGRDNGNDKKQSTSRDKPTTSTTTQNKTISSSTKPNPIPQNQNIDPSNTPSKDVSEREDKDKERENTSNNKITKTQSHTLQYEYFPVISESKPVDPESGTLQGTEEIINKAMLQNVVQRDLERRKDVAKTPPSSSISSSSSSPSPPSPPSFYSSPRVSRSGSPVVTVPTTAETETEAEADAKGVKSSEKLSEPRISATAAIMMKLYKDESQMVYEKTSQKQKQTQTHTVARQNSNTYSDYSETSDYEHRETYATEHDQSSVPSLSSSPAPYTGEEAVTLTNNNNNDRPGSVSPTPSRSLTDTDSASNVDMGVGTGMSDDDETVQVVLKWRDPLENPSKTRIFLVSEDIVSTLLASNSSITINIVDKKKFKMCMLFDYSSNEWFVPGLLLPPGIYRLQFLVNGVMTHSSFLPTATNSAGTIVNWFEVLPGYNKIEPFRDDTQIQSSNVNVDKTQTFTSNALSSTSLTDYAGISRSDSVVVGKSLLTSLKLTNLQLEDKPKLTYSNQIPEIFKFDPPENPDEPPKVAFSLTLPKVVDFNQDTLFANIQSAGKMSAEDAEAFFLNRFKVPNLPIYLNSTYLNKNFGNDQNHIIPHVNLNHLLTSSIKDDMVCVGCTTRYAGKFITQVLYYPCSVEASSQGTGREEEDV